MCHTTDDSDTSGLISVDHRLSIFLLFTLLASRKPHNATEKQFAEAAEPTLQGGEVLLNRTLLPEQLILSLISKMAASPERKPDLKMPIPPPLLHTRSGNEIYERPRTPHTPTQTGFTSPLATPQGSPSKKSMPPGANDLPNVFDNAMKLGVMSPSKKQPTSPAKQALSVADDNLSNVNPFSESVIQSGSPGSPLRKSNKENTPPGGARFGKDIGLQQNAAAISRQEQYQQVESRKAQTNTTRGLTPEELEKLQSAKVKRLANVTQLCK